MLNILIVDESRVRAEAVCGALALAGHRVAAVLADAHALAAQVAALRPDVILIETDSPSRDTLEHLAVMNRELPHPVVILTADADRDRMRTALRAGVAAYVVDNVDLARLTSIIDVAVARFEAHQALKAELAAATRKLSERKLIEQAKGVLMKTRGIDEPAAHALLRSLAMERAQPMARVASDLLAMAKVLL